MVKVQVDDILAGMFLTYRYDFLVDRIYLFFAIDNNDVIYFTAIVPVQVKPACLLVEIGCNSTVRAFYPEVYIISEMIRPTGSDDEFRLLLHVGLPGLGIDVKQRDEIEKRKAQHAVEQEIDKWVGIQHIPAAFSIQTAHALLDGTAQGFKRLRPLSISLRATSIPSCRYPNDIRHQVVSIAVHDLAVHAKQH